MTLFDPPAPPPDPPPIRSSSAEHMDRMTERAEAALVAAGLPVVALEVLRRAGIEYCICCGYKRKARTGESSPVAGELAPLDGLEQVIRNPQRDGDDGDLGRRMRHDLAILRCLVRAPMTDEEVCAFTGIYHTSAVGARAGLVKGGWVRATDRKRESQNGRPMTVWELTPRARARLGLA